MPDVILLGDINIDIISTHPAYPAWGTEGVATAVEYHTGGSVVNTSAALAKLGVEAGLIGRIGTDALAGQVINDLEKIGIDKSHIQIDESVSTGLIYIVVTPDGERTMFSSRGANVFIELTDELEEYFSNARWYHFTGYSLLAQPQQNTAITSLEIARQNHCRVSLDPSPEPSMRVGKQIKELLSKIDILFPNEQEVKFLAGDSDSLKDSIQSLLDQGSKAVAVKCGSKGCIIAYDSNYHEIPSFDVKVQDTTGAGDSFNAGVVMGRMVGLSWPASGIIGNALGALACSVRGSGATEVTSTQVEELIVKDQFKERWVKWQPAMEEVLAWLYVT